MPIAAVALVLTAALLHALWNIVLKRSGSNRHLPLITSLTLMVVWAPVGLWVGVDAVPHWGATEWALMLASGITHVLYFNVLLRGYRMSDLTVVYPVARGTGPLISSFGAVLLLGESLSVAGVSGVISVAFGVFLIAGGPGLWRAAHDPARRARVHAGLGYGALTGCLIASYTLVDGYAVKVALISPILVDYVGNLLRIPFMLPSALRDRPGFVQACRAHWRVGLVVALVAPLAYVLVLYAVQLAPLSHVAPAREVSMLFAALLAGSLLGEGDRGLRLLGAAFIAGGVIALALG